MEELFAYKIVINKLLGIENFEIPLSETERKHLIITGKNGSGKTTLLRDLKAFILRITEINSSLVLSYLERIKFHSSNISFVNANPDWQADAPSKREEYLKHQEEAKENQLSTLKSENSFFFLNKPETISNEFYGGNFIFAFFKAKRHDPIKIPKGVTKIEIKKYYEVEDNAGNDFFQYIVNRKVDEAFARIDKETEKAENIRIWFNNFEKNLLKLFDIEDAELEFDSKNYSFNIVENNKPAYKLSELPDGYFAILDIVSELIMRMREHNANSYDVQGIVLIDEIETHLHIALQKKILPFLTSFFPRIQFIVTTHSPFVISSVSNAVICDLEKKIVVEDMSAYSYEAIVESYFNVDEYSTEAHEKLNSFKALVYKVDLNDDEKYQLMLLEKYFNEIPKFLSNGLSSEINRLKLYKKFGTAKNTEDI